MKTFIIDKKLKFCRIDNKIGIGRSDKDSRKFPCKNQLDLSIITREIAISKYCVQLRAYIPFSGSKNQKNLYCLFFKYTLLTMFLQNFIEIGALEPKIRPFIVRSFWNYLMST